MPDRVTVTLDGREVRVVPGTCLGEIVGLALPCGGHGQCGKCKVRATGSLSPMSESEGRLLSAREVAGGIRLACRTIVTGPCTVETACIAPRAGGVLTDGSVRVTGGTPAFGRLGCAVDVGTTTLAAALVTPDGRTLATCGRANPQAAFGGDVVARIEAALGGKAEVLADVLLRALAELIRELCARAGTEADEIDGIVVTGNTAMLLLLTRTSPEGLAHAPFVLPRRFGETVRAAQLGLGVVSPDTAVYFPPCISAFVGADTVCAILSSGLSEERGIGMLADVGTNGEMAVCKEGKLTVCSTAAGPAFEGVGISQGMCGVPGAIDRVRVANGRLFAHVIGEGEALGICGSGLVDAIAALLQTEALDPSGFLEDGEAPIRGQVVLTQGDVRMLQLAKSAVAAGLGALLHAVGASAEDVQTFFLAGGFGCFLNVQNAVRIGMIPPGLASKPRSVGNAALGGAVMLLLDRDLRAQALRLATEAETLALATDPYFADAFVDGMLFPDPDRGALDA